MYATGPAKVGALETLRDLAAGNYRVVDLRGALLSSSPQVIKVSPGTLRLSIA
jgi:hypothetical protein